MIDICNSESIERGITAKHRSPFLIPILYRRNTDKSNLTTRKESRFTMQILNRLKMELSNQEYFTDEQYIQFLTENNLSPTEEYDKPTMQKQLLFTVIDVLEAVTNDIDLMTGISVLRSKNWAGKG